MGCGPTPRTESDLPWSLNKLANSLQPQRSWRVRCNTRIWEPRGVVRKEAGGAMRAMAIEQRVRPMRCGTCRRLGADPHHAPVHDAVRRGFEQGSREGSSGRSQLDAPAGNLPVSSVTRDAGGLNGSRAACVEPMTLQPLSLGEGKGTHAQGQRCDLGAACPCKRLAMDQFCRGRGCRWTSRQERWPLARSWGCWFLSCCRARTSRELSPEAE